MIAKNIGVYDLVKSEAIYKEFLFTFGKIFKVNYIKNRNFQ